MKQSILKFFDRFTPIDALRFGTLGLVKKMTSTDAILTYSQTGEDRIVMDLLKGIRNGFYVEVGSNDPTHYSNTFAFYCRGWRGITIDANAGLVQKHRQLRKRDIPVCAAVSNVEEEVVFVEYDVHELSTISQQTVAVLERQANTIKRETRLQTVTLTTILANYLPQGVAIDLLSIDVEGHDLNVLLSVDLSVYRPKVVVIEMHDFELKTYYANPIYQHLTDQDYVFAGYAIWNGYFVDRAYWESKNR